MAAGLGLWWWLGVAGLNVAPGLEAWADSTQVSGLTWLGPLLERAAKWLGPALPWVLLACAVAGPLTGSLILALAFALWAAASMPLVHGLSAVFGIAPSSGFDPGLLVAPALVGYLLITRAGAVSWSVRPEKSRGRVTPCRDRAGVRTSRAAWLLGQPAGPFLCLGVAAAAAFGLIYGGAWVWLTQGGLSGQGPGAAVLAVAAVAGTGLWVLAAAAADLIDIVLPKAGTRGRLLIGLWQGFWGGQRLALNAIAHQLVAWSRNPRAKVRYGLGRTVALLAPAGGLYYLVYAGHLDAILASADAWAVRLDPQVEGLASTVYSWLAGLVDRLIAILFSLWGVGG